MQQIKIIALVIVAVFLMSGLGATVIPPQAAHMNAKIHAAGAPMNKLAFPPSVQWEKTYSLDITSA